MRVGIAADHGGLELKQHLAQRLEQAGYAVVDFGAMESAPDDDYPDYIVPLARAVSQRQVERGLALCGSGVGACMVANRVPGVRAALVHESFSARQGVEDDDMNVICLGGMVVDLPTAWELARTFLEAQFTGALRHRRRLAKMAALEQLPSSDAQHQRDLAQALEQQVAERTAHEVHRANVVRDLALRLSQAEQRERRRLAQILHDHLQQILVAARLKASVLRRRLPDESLHPTVGQIEALLKEAIDASRSLTVELSPPILYDAGLLAGLEWLGRQMEEKHGLSVEVQGDRDAEPPSEDLRFLLFQVVRELLFNVVKHAQMERATVRLWRKNPEEIGILVADEGPGFDPAALGRNPPSGFGLLDIRERLKWVGGRLEIDSAAGGGARLAVIVPCQAPATAEVARHPAAHLPGPAPGPLGRKIRVLLADDHELVRHGLGGLLREVADIDVVGEAADGQQAVDLVRQTNPDVVLMDVVMPRVGGIEATRQVLDHSPHLRVIGLSMHEAPEMADAMREAGAVAYLRKDCGCEELIATIRRVIDAPK